MTWEIALNSPPLQIEIRIGNIRLEIRIPCPVKRRPNCETTRRSASMPSQNRYCRIESSIQLSVFVAVQVDIMRFNGKDIIIERVSKEDHLLTTSEPLPHDYGY
jgi:hypothetical protein